MPEFHVLDAAGVRLRVAVAGEGPLVLLVHGFPESWYSWRHQMDPMAEAGFTVAAVDLRGYGGSDKPHPIEAYAMERMTADMTAVVEALQPGKPAILIGHDWGAAIVWNAALTRPESVLAVAALSVPYTGVPSRPFTEVFDENFTRKGRFFYQAWFQQVGPPEAEAEADIRSFLRRFYYAISGEGPPWPEKPLGATLLEGLDDPRVFPAWMTEADLDYFVGEFQNSGFRGPINRYRNHARDFAWLQGFKRHVIQQPSFFSRGTKDPASTLFGRLSDPIAAMGPYVPNLVAGHMLEGCGHWTQQERPREVTNLLLGWLKGLPIG